MPDLTRMLKYVLITPAHNEEARLEQTILAVLKQAQRPDRWVIVNDGSTDATRAIAERYSRREGFIDTLTIERTGAHAFGNKARAFNEALKGLEKHNYRLVGNLDADITVEADYYEKVVQAFQSEDQLGICGGSVYTKIGDRFVTYDLTSDSVAGAVQMFRRECLEDIGGGYLPLPYGGIDAAAEIVARMRGWKVSKLANSRVLEHRQTGTADRRPVAASFRLGRRFHSLGYGFLFYSLRCLYRIADEPVLIGSAAQLLGFLESFVRRRPVLLPHSVVSDLRSRQRKRLWAMLGGFSIPTSVTERASL